MIEVNKVICIAIDLCFIDFYVRIKNHQYHQSKGKGVLDICAKEH